MNREELHHCWALLRRIDLNDNDGADIYEFEAFAREMEAKYNKPFNEIEACSSVPTWEFPLFNSDGAYGPRPKIGKWTADGWLTSCRDMSRDEQLSELFADTASDWRRFRAWLERVNPAEFRWLNRYCENWS